MSFLKKILKFILRLLAQRVLIKYQPDIIGITGSVGKTSTKEAIFCVLKNSFKVRKNEKNYNNELGVPLTIINGEAKGKSVFGWLSVFFNALKIIFFKNRDYPQILILEMGADHPGDIKYLTSLAPCKIGVLTAIGPTHLEYFGSVAEVKKEKKIIVTHLSADKQAILNRDDEQVWSVRNDVRASIISYGLHEDSLLKASDIILSQSREGISFKMSYKGSVVPVILPNFLAKVQVYNVLAAAAVGVVYDLNLLEIAESLKELMPAKGRMRLLNGIKETKIIDDTYNSSPKAAAAALKTIAEMLCEGDKIAVLGDMLELGEVTEEEHFKLGSLVVESKINYLVTVGHRSRAIAQGALEAGLSADRIINFANADEARIPVQNKIKKGDLILVKGSRGMHLEKIVKEIMLEPLRASELLVGY